MTHATDQTWYPRRVVKARRANAPLATAGSAALPSATTQKMPPRALRDAPGSNGTQHPPMMPTMERPATSSRTLIQVPVHNFRDLFLGHSPYDLIGYLSALEDK